MAVGAVSRIRDEIKYKNAVEEEKERVDKARFEREQATEQAQNVSRYRQQLEQQAQDPMLQSAIQASQAFEANKPGPVDLGYAGFQQTGATGMGVPTGQTMGAVGQPMAPSYDRYSHEDLLRMGEEQAQLDAMRQQEAAAMQAIGPEVQERFIPRTVAEFQMAIANEPDPQRRQQLLIESSRAVDLQPESVDAAIRGTAGRTIQKGLRKADLASQKKSFEQAKTLEELGRKRDEFDFDAQYKEAKHNLNVFAERSKAEKRTSEVNLNEAKLKKFNRRMAASMRRRGSPSWFKTLIKEKYNGSFSSAVNDGNIYDNMMEAAPNQRQFDRQRKNIIDHLKKTGLSDEAYDAGVRSEMAIAADAVKSSKRAMDKVNQEEGAAEAELQAMTPVAAQLLGMTGAEGIIYDDPTLPANWYDSPEIMGRSELNDIRKTALKARAAMKSGAKKREAARKTYEAAVSDHKKIIDRANKRSGAPASQPVAPSQASVAAQAGYKIEPE
tara:strand:- start:30734 stop:32224 length:1491 start_codon:yes stop_codon:yes gene_type:complete